MVRVGLRRSWAKVQLGNPGPEHVERIHGRVRAYTGVEGIARLVTLDEITANDHNLNIPRYVEPKGTSEVLTVEAAMKRLRESA